mgnify:CR=1 FL=1
MVVNQPTVRRTSTSGRSTDRPCPPRSTATDPLPTVAATARLRAASSRSSSEIRSRRRASSTSAVWAAFSDDGRARAGMGVDVGDFARTGRMGLAVTNFDNEMMGLYEATGKGFTDRAVAAGVGAATRQRLGFGCLFADFDHTRYASPADATLAFYGLLAERGIPASLVDRKSLTTPGQPESEAESKPPACKNL